MDQHMVGLVITSDKILVSVVCRISVYVVRNRSDAENLPHRFFHDKDVLRNIPIFIRSGMPRHYSPQIPEGMMFHAAGSSFAVSAV
jgi:hypothetical protein